MLRSLFATVPPSSFACMMQCCCLAWHIALRKQCNSLSEHFTEVMFTPDSHAYHVSCLKQSTLFTIQVSSQTPSFRDKGVQTNSWNKGNQVYIMYAMLCQKRCSCDSSVHAGWIQQFIQQVTRRISLLQAHMTPDRYACQKPYKQK